jgi:hypothetical protein
LQQSLLPLVLYNVVNRIQRRRGHLDSREIAAILRFCLAETEEVRGLGAEVLPEELLIKLRSFAAGKLKREDLEEFSEKIASNTAAIEALAHEIKQHWGRNQNSNE